MKSSKRGGGWDKRWLAVGLLFAIWYVVANTNSNQNTYSVAVPVDNNLALGTAATNEVISITGRVKDVQLFENRSDVRLITLDNGKQIIQPVASDRNIIVGEIWTFTGKTNQLGQIDTRGYLGAQKPKSISLKGKITNIEKDSSNSNRIIITVLGKKIFISADPYAKVNNTFDGQIVIKTSIDIYDVDGVPVIGTPEERTAQAIKDVTDAENNTKLNKNNVEKSVKDAQAALDKLRASKASQDLINKAEQNLADARKGLKNVWDAAFNAFLKARDVRGTKLQIDDNIRINTTASKREAARLQGRLTEIYNTNYQYTAPADGKW